MPRGPRLDFPGALHHVIARGIERRLIFRNDRDRQLFLSRLTALVAKSGAALYAWCLMPNHVHLLLRSGPLPLSRLMQALLGSYAIAYNSRHRRAGHLFQNRFKAILVEEDAYLLELVRYIHLNPVRSQLPVDIDSLDTFRWTGHAALLGRHLCQAQDVEFILKQFGHPLAQARLRYRAFVRESVNAPVPDLNGGGLRRSRNGNWEAAAALTRGREQWAFDERILGSSDFVRRIIEGLDPPDSPLRRGNPQEVLDQLSRVVAERYPIPLPRLRSGARDRHTVNARAAVCALAVDHCGISQVETARHLFTSPQSVARGVERGRTILELRHWTPNDLLRG